MRRFLHWVEKVDYDLVGITMDGLIAMTAAWLIVDVLRLVS